MEDLVTVPVMVLSVHASMDMQENIVKYLQVYTVYLVCHSAVDISPFIKIMLNKSHIFYPKITVL